MHKRSECITAIWRGVLLAAERLKHLCIA